MLRVSRAVKPFATVLLTGDGGDDVFLGYPEHRTLWLSQKLARSLPASAAALWPAVRTLVPKRGVFLRAAHFLDYATGGLGDVARTHDGLPAYQRYGVLGDRLADATIPQRGIPRSIQSARNLLEEFLVYDRQTRFAGEYLPKVDGGTMHYALEARSPFLDQELWNFAASLPFSLRLHGGTLKAVLRELARRNIGERVASGPKRGFGIPVQRWLTGRWRDAFETSFQDSLLEREGFIRTSAVRSTLQQAVARGTAPNQLWYLYVLETWFRQEQAARPLTSV
jgi:asparagine synthase (glutamine-hydrolysing)